MEFERDPIFDRVFSVLRWTARTAALALTAVLLAMLLRAPAADAPLAATPGVPLAALIAALTGLLLAWFWEGPGAALILLSFLLYSVANRSVPVNVVFMALLLTGVLFLFSWMRGRLLRRSRRQDRSSRG